MKKVYDLIKEKGIEVYSVSPDTSLMDALKVMSDHDIGAVMVVEGSKIRGVFSERDYARKVILSGKHCKESKVKDFMTTEVISISPGKSLYDCMEIMTNKKIRHLPILDGGKVIGIVTIGDVVKDIILNLQSTIKDMHSFISGSPA